MMASSELVLVEPINRPIAITKLIFDTRITMRSSSLGRNLIVGVPHYCHTVGDFKNYLVGKYLQVPSLIQLFLDEFCIPDDECSQMFPLIHEHIRVVFVEESKTGPLSIPPPVSTTPGILKNTNFPDKNYAVVSSQNSNKKRIKFDASEIPTPILKKCASKGEKKSKYNRNNTTVRKEQESTDTEIEIGFDQIDFPHEKSPEFNVTMPITLESERRLTSSAKRRHRLRRSMENKVAANNNIVSVVPYTHNVPFTLEEEKLVSTQTSANKITGKEKATKKIALDFTDASIVTPESTGNEPVLPPIYRRKNYTKETHTSKPDVDAWSDSLEELEKSDTVPLISPKTSGIKRKHPPSELMETPPFKFERSSSSRPDTPFIPKSVKNPVAYDILKTFEFSNGKIEKKTSGRGPAYLQDTFKKLVMKLEEVAGVNADEEEISSSKQQESETEGRVMGEVTAVLETQNRSDVVDGATGPLDPSFYDSLQPILRFEDISENSIIAFKMLEMGENYEARYSEFKEALVIGNSNGRLNLEYLKADSIIRSGKFEIEGYESEEISNPTMVHFTTLIQPKLVGKAETMENSPVNH